MWLNYCINDYDVNIKVSKLPEENIELEYWMDENKIKRKQLVYSLELKNKIFDKFDESKLRNDQCSAWGLPIYYLDYLRYNSGYKNIFEMLVIDNFSLIQEVDENKNKNDLFNYTKNEIIKFINKYSDILTGKYEIYGVCEPININ